MKIKKIQRKLKKMKNIFLQVFFIEQDRLLFSTEHNEGVSCRALNITEELGNIQHVFCDKTGTLTENSMVFRSASIGGINYPHLKQAQNIRMANHEAELARIGNSKNFGNLEFSDSEILDSGELEGEAHRKPKRHQRKITESGAQELHDDPEASGDDLETKVLPDENLIKWVTGFDETNETGQFGKIIKNMSKKSETST